MYRERVAGAARTPPVGGTPPGRDRWPTWHGTTGIPRGVRIELGPAVGSGGVGKGGVVAMTNRVSQEENFNR